MEKHRDGEFSINISLQIQSQLLQQLWEIKTLLQEHNYLQNDAPLTEAHRYDLQNRFETFLQSCLHLLERQNEYTSMIMSSLVKVLEPFLKNKDVSAVFQQAEIKTKVRNFHHLLCDNTKKPNVSESSPIGQHDASIIPLHQKNTAQAIQGVTTGKTHQEHPTDRYEITCEERPLDWTVKMLLLFPYDIPQAIATLKKVLIQNGVSFAEPAEQEQFTALAEALQKEIVQQEQGISLKVVMIVNKDPSHKHMYRIAPYYFDFLRKDT